MVQCKFTAFLAGCIFILQVCMDAEATMFIVPISQHNAYTVGRTSITIDNADHAYRCIKNNSPANRVESCKQHFINVRGRFVGSNYVKPQDDRLWLRLFTGFVHGYEFFLRYNEHHPAPQGMSLRQRKTNALIKFKQFENRK